MRGWWGYLFVCFIFMGFCGREILVGLVFWGVVFFYCFVVSYFSYLFDHWYGAQVG